MTPETNPIPSQNALKRAEIIEQIANKWLPDMETPSLDARYISLKAAIEETLHAAEQRGMEKVAGICEERADALDAVRGHHLEAFAVVDAADAIRKAKEGL